MYSVRICILLFCVVFALLGTRAQRSEKITFTHTYTSDNNSLSFNEARSEAFAEAQRRALAEKFGERVAEQNTLNMEVVNGHQNSRLYTVGISEVKGEWLKLSKQKVLDSKWENGFWIIKVMVEGTAREVVSAGVPLQCKWLRNGTDAYCESDRFKNDDYVYLQFQSPIDGHLAVYLVDDTCAYCMLPYQEQTSVGAYPVKANQQYVFFSPQHIQDDEYGFNVPLHIVTNKQEEMNTLIAIFSPSSFVGVRSATAVAISNTRVLAPVVSRDAFEKWLYRSRNRDNRMQVVDKVITVSK